MTDAMRSRQAEEGNLELWNEMACVHVKAYEEVGLLRRGGEVLDEIELREVGDVRGKTMLHLQCHIGTDTLAWARRGAIVTGVDFSDRAIACAEQLRDELGLAATFVRSNVYDLPSALSGEFDIVYTSRGVLCWLSDLDEWARIIAGFLKPGGVFYLMEAHPILNALEEQPSGELAFTCRYFHRAEPTAWEPGGPDYADPTHKLEHASHEWDWSMGDILNALLSAGLRLEFVNEYERLFERRYPSMTADEGRGYRLPRYTGRLPLLFTLRARKPTV